MASSLPFAVRVTAGALATGLDQLRRLPAELPGLSVTIAGRAMRTSMRIRQEFTELATRGDALLSPLVDRPEENPTWARFDDEESPPDGGSSHDDAAGDGSSHDDAAGDGSSHDHAANSGPADTAATGPAAMPGYDDLRLAQVRARMIRLTSPELAALLAYEEAGQARASFITMLQNRITTLAGHHGGNSPEDRPAGHRSAGHVDSRHPRGQHTPPEPRRPA